MNANMTIAEIEHMLELYTKETIMTREQLQKAQLPQKTYKAGAFDQQKDLHDGQLKLALCEYLTLALALLYEKQKLETSGVESADAQMILKNTVVLYIGAAGGTESHLRDLAKCFPHVKFHLYDPKFMHIDALNDVHADKFASNIQCNIKPENSKQFTFHQQFFKPADVKAWSDWKQANPQCILFVINDIRSSFDWPLYYRRRELAIDLLRHQNDIKENMETYKRVVFDLIEQNYLHSHQLETIICEDTMRPQIWALQMQADYFLSKERDPWPGYWESKDNTDKSISQVQGLHFLQAYARNSSNEQRLFVAKKQQEASRFASMLINPQSVTQLEFRGSVNDVEIEPQWNKAHDSVDWQWLKKDNNTLAKLTAGEQPYDLDKAINYASIEQIMFEYNSTRNGGGQDNKMQSVIQTILNAYIEEFGVGITHEIRQAKCIRRNKTHGKTKQAREHKNEWNSTMGRLELDYVNDSSKDKSSFWHSWQTTHVKQKIFDTTNVLQGMQANLLKLMQDKTQYKAQTEYSSVSKAPVYYTEEHARWKLHLLTLMLLQPESNYIEKLMKKFLAAHEENQEQKWLIYYCIAQLRYYFIEFGLTESLKIRQEALHTTLGTFLEKGRQLVENDQIRCFMPGVISTTHMQVLTNQNFFCDRYWAICLYRQFMTFLKHNIHLSAKEFEQWTWYYVQDNDQYQPCLAYISGQGNSGQNNKQWRFFDNWPWKNSFFHAAANYGNHEVVGFLLAKNYVQNINRQRLSDGNTAINLVWYQIDNETNKETNKQNVQYLNRLLETSKVLRENNVDIHIENDYHETAGIFAKRVREKKVSANLKSEAEIMPEMHVNARNPFFLYFDTVA